MAASAHRTVSCSHHPAGRSADGSGLQLCDCPLRPAPRRAEGR
ncbi:hypothetical protein FHS40_004691 [Streptomyces spectabilis]|uniref:Uncharacterized protein n=1 Tax=Streptomyces spectabilis TaxID=68270 RepID=A0A7W8EVG2_STRST|nr:hypothetical protein [Streptomyces spectabilis]